ncbi:integrase [Mesorhizobium sp. LNHC252B00]|uniref:site-specific integrase n=1 Tax=Mesorhizobium sp. LNHC252B00 TaxID=1287252 RepID=UPI0003CE4807|nr:site-specific integrase [Mesorhizobium sp. LNHC252B00]ESY64009.1 integrase [Mesorhizobium sp. LNHC252B00]
MAKLTKTVVDAALPRERQYTVWCSDLKGFGVFVQPSGSRTYFVDYRNSSGVRRRMTIGRHGTITTEQARKLAITNLGETLKGEDPAEERNSKRTSLTVKELCDRYLDATERGLILGKANRPKKSSTLYTDRGRIRRHIVPLLGAKRVRDLRSADINRFIRDVASGKTAVVEKTGKKRGKSIVRGGLGTAARTAGLLGGILSFAISEGIIELHPAEGVRRPADKHRQRRLTEEEYRQLGAALAGLQVDGELEQALHGAWLLALTGCRLGEVVKLKWSEVDQGAGCFRLEDSKEGASIRPIGKAAFEIIAVVKRDVDCRFVLRPARNGEAFGGMPKGWLRIAKRAKLEGVTPHTLRHSFASVAGDLGYSEPTIAAMLGHSSSTITSRYVHHLDAVLIAAADNVASEIHRFMVGPKAAPPSDRRAQESVL